MHRILGIVDKKSKLDLSPLGISAKVSCIFVVDVPPAGIVELSKCALLFFPSGSFALHVEISSEDCVIAKLLSLFELTFVCVICFFMGDFKSGSLTRLVQNEI